jgi:hypothetical protein
VPVFWTPTLAFIGAFSNGERLGWAAAWPAAAEIVAAKVVAASRLRELCGDMGESS